MAAMSARYRIPVASRDLLAQLRANPPTGWTVGDTRPVEPESYEVDIEDEHAPDYLNGHLVETILQKNFATGEATVMGYRVVQPGTRMLADTERAHVASWTDAEWLHVIATVDPYADLSAAIAAVDQLRTGEQPHPGGPE